MQRREKIAHRNKLFLGLLINYMAADECFPFAWYVYVDSSIEHTNLANDNCLDLIWFRQQTTPLVCANKTIIIWGGGDQM